jgi:hypothetical protein
MTRPETALDEAARELQAAEHDVRVAFDCIELGELDRAHTHALTARVATDAAVTALAVVLAEAGPGAGAGPGPGPGAGPGTVTHPAGRPARRWPR